jgi:hypothetical protein
VVVCPSDDWPAVIPSIDDTVSCIESESGRTTDSNSRACKCCSSPNDWATIKSTIDNTVSGVKCQGTGSCYNRAMHWCMPTDDWAAIISSINNTVSSIEGQSGAHPSRL